MFAKRYSVIPHARLLRGYESASKIARRKRRDKSKHRVEILSRAPYGFGLVCFKQITKFHYFRGSNLARPQAAR